MGRLRSLIFGISPDEATFSRRGFTCGDERVRLRLERIGQIFLHGYHLALEARGEEQLAWQLHAVEAELRGFAFEGAAMALMLLDLMLPWGGKRRFNSLLAGAGSAHAYMLYVGAGWALARLKRDTRLALRGFDPLLGWLALDGYGFHEGYFNWPTYVVQQQRPRRLNGYALRVFDQGLGRSLWFVVGADVERLAAAIAAFAEPRQADLWSGVGLACAYAGDINGAQLELLRDKSGRFAPYLAQGAAFAAKARQRAGNPACHTEQACCILCGRSADVAAGVVDAVLRSLPPAGDEPAYEMWRQGIASKFMPAQVVAAECVGAVEPASGFTVALSSVKEQFT